MAEMAGDVKYELQRRDPQSDVVFGPMKGRVKDLYTYGDHVYCSTKVKPVGCDWIAYESPEAGMYRFGRMHGRGKTARVGDFAGEKCTSLVGENAPKVYAVVIEVRHKVFWPRPRRRRVWNAGGQRAEKG